MRTRSLGAATPWAAIQAAVHPRLSPWQGPLHCKRACASEGGRPGSRFARNEIEEFASGLLQIFAACVQVDAEVLQDCEGLDRDDRKDMPVDTDSMGTLVSTSFIESPVIGR